MAENNPAQYVLPLNETTQAGRLSKDLESLGIHIESSTEQTQTLNAVNGSQMLPDCKNIVSVKQDKNEGIKQNFTTIITQEELPCLVQIVYPEDLNLCPAQNYLKRGRSKKKKQNYKIAGNSDSNTSVSKSANEITALKPARTRSGRLVKLPKHIRKDFKKIEITSEEQEFQITDFQQFEERENVKHEFTALQAKKKVITAQNKCPKCFKAYLGKAKMIEHLKKNPDHGPLPENYQEYNFDVWNYLFDITQKCKPGQKGIKFCEELSNLLHNVQLLKNALFKSVTDNKNCVHIDKVLGNAIGLAPGKYTFNEKELYKDVTVLKLITNSDFFKPNTNSKQANDAATNKTDGENILNEGQVSVGACVTEKYEDSPTKTGGLNENVNVFSCKNTNSDNNSISETKIQENEVLDFSKKMEVDTQILPSDLLSENLLLHSLPNQRNSVDELILTSVDNASNLLDNSTSSDEVMNVDQFVNERFKKIIEPDIELSNTSLNLDLPGLELFQFHTS